MRNVIKGVLETCKVIFYCIKILWETSPKYFIIRIVFGIISLFVPFIIIMLTQMILNFLAGDRMSAVETDIQSFFVFSLLLLVFNILNKSVETLNGYFIGLQREMMESVTKHCTMRKAAELDLSFFDSVDFYNEVNDANRNSPLITNAAFLAFDLLRYFFQFFIAYVYLFQFNPILPLIFVISVIPCTIAQIRQVEAIYGFQRQYMNEERKMQYISEVVLSRDFAKDVRIYNIFPFISKKFLDIWHDLFSKKREISLRFTMIVLVLSIFPEIVAAVSLILLGMSVIKGVHTIGDYSFLQGIMTQILGGLHMLIYSYTQLTDGKIRIQNYRKFLNFKSKICENGGIELTKQAFMIEFKNVSFRYDENLPWVLKNVSFTFHSRQKIALVGANGSGKTTIIKLLLRFYDPVEGQILMDGIDIREYTLDSVRRCFTTVFQDFSNYAFTIRESVSLSDVNQASDEERIREAIKKSGIDDFITRFPKGLDTYLTRRYDESGEELSGGQWQKMAIARAFFRKAHIYILDEPSSALDAQSEDEVFRMFSKMYAGGGAVLISHRLSNVHLSDLILVLNKGLLVEIGTHEKLMEDNGLYAHMYQLQAEKYKSAEK